MPVSNWITAFAENDNNKFYSLSTQPEYSLVETSDKTRVGSVVEAKSNRFDRILKDEHSKGIATQIAAILAEL